MSAGGRRGREGGVTGTHACFVVENSSGYCRQMAIIFGLLMSGSTTTATQKRNASEKSE